ncbi:MAG: SusC/RagA family TonB-linked outer membrane protein [Mediterranea sp.]|nr:SusC/RagA family TonB-linked outer membrane protein [Mediterranea sp.]
MKENYSQHAMKKMCLVILFLLTNIFTYSQTLIRGRVINEETKEPIVGATVAIKATASGVITNLNGAFELRTNRELPLSLNISFIGYKAQIVDVYDADEQILVTLVENNNLLNEVVVTALGIQRERSALPYATQRISSDDLVRTPATSLATSLSGKIAGLQITSANTLGGTNNVILRGFKSLTQSNQALFVIDGVPIDNSNLNTNGLDLGNTISDINPEDVESVNVLKGAAASALYGSRAVNGVIVINTKKGAKGSKLNVVFNQGVKTGVVDKNTLPSYQTQYGQGKGTYGNNTTDAWFYYQPTFNSENPSRIVITNQDLAWGPAYNASTLVYTWESFVPGNPNYGKEIPWVASSNNDPAAYFETPWSTNTSIFLNGGTEQSAYKVGYTYDNNDGSTPNSYINKHSFNFKWTQELIKDVTIGTSFNYSKASARNRSAYDYRASNSNVRDLRQWLPSNVDYKAQRADYERGYNASWNILAGSYAVQQSDNVIKAAYHNNVYWNDYENYNNDSRDRYFGNVFVTYDIIEGLQATARISIDNYTQFFEDRIAEGSISTSRYYRSDIKYGENNYDLLLNYNKKVSDKFTLRALLGGTIRRTSTENISAETSGGLAVPGLYAISNSKGQPAAPQEYVGNKQVNSLFAGVTLEYKNLLTFDVTGRQDQASTLPENNNSYFYPAISGGFIFSSLLPRYEWLNLAKLRLNYAEVGSDAPYYSIRNTYTANSPFGGQNIFSVPATNNNPNLKPERNKSYEVGLESAFLDNRINIDLTYYHSRLNDQITPITVSSASGYNKFYVNGGTIQNQGVELSLNINPVRTHHFNYDLTLNWSKNQNEVISLYGDQPSYTIAQYHNSVQLVAEVGKPYGILRGTDYEYLNGQPLVDENGYYVKKASNNNADLGKVTPDWIGGITNRFRYKDFTLSFLVDVSQGGNIYSLDMDNGSRSGILAHTAETNNLGNPLRNPLSEGGGIILPGVKEDGKPNNIRVDASDAQKLGTKLPFGSTNALTAKSYIYDASYVKLREVAFAYSLPQTVVGSSKIVKGVTFTLSGRNLWIIHKNLPYSDPEQGSPSTTLTSGAAMIYNPNASLGYQNAVYPALKEIAFNVKLNF